MKYEKQYILLHKQNLFKGLSTLAHKDQIALLIKQTRSSSLLDYGSGKGLQYKKVKLDQYWGVDVDCYDPFYEPYNIIPDKKYDGVICVEVLEHVPEEELSLVLTNIFSKAINFAFFTVCTRPAKKLFDDGTNVHVTIRDLDWWTDTIQQYNKDRIIIEIVTTS